MNVEILDELAAKSKRSKKAAEEGARLLVEAFSENQSWDFAAEYLMKFNFRACPIFLENTVFSEIEAEQLANALISSKAIKSKNFASGFAVCRFFSDRGLNKKITAKLADEIIRNGRSSNGFSAGLISDFNKIFSDKRSLEKFSALGNSEIGKNISELCETAAKNGSRSVDAAELERKLREAEDEIRDLNSRLEQAFKMNEMSRDSELMTLKTSLSKALKDEYRDFISGGSEFTPDNFQANYASLLRIFKILKRFGFTFE